MTIFRYAIIKGLRNPLTMIFNAILPILIVLIRPLWTGESNLTGYGLLFLVIWAGCFMMSQGILRDRETGALTRIMAAPISMRNYLMQNLLAYMVPLGTAVIIACVLGAALYDWTLVFTLGLLLMSVVFIAASVTMSFAWTSLFKSKETSTTSFSAIMTLGVMLSGTFFPLHVLPTMLQNVGAIFPAYWAVRAITHLGEAGTMGQDYWTGIAALTLFTAAFLLFGGRRKMM